MSRYPRAAVEIGNARGRIALYLDETEAIDLAHHYGHGDLAYQELMEAVETAYPADERIATRPTTRSTRTRSGVWRLDPDSISVATEPKRPPPPTISV